jgi:glycosyltransferase involved in cell wall biosynthesis
MALTVLSVAYPFAPVSSDAVGGAEQVLARLDAALVQAGHRSIVIACAGSRVAGELVETPPVPRRIDELARERAREAIRESIRSALDQRPVDLVHLHGVDFAGYLPEPGVPVLATMHLPAECYATVSFARPDTQLQCVSYSQAATFPGRLPVIENGVPIPAPERHAKRHFALALGRICPEKNLATALEAARHADVGCLLGGAVFPYPEHERYFRSEIVPRLDARRRFLGPLGGVRKRRLLAAARCVLLPSVVAETSSLVAMEALAAGTPVVAFPSGALREIVEHGRTGFLVSNIAEMADAIHAAGELRSEDCREAATRRFPLPRMIAGYFAMYRKLAAREEEVCVAS